MDQLPDTVLPDRACDARDLLTTAAFEGVVATVQGNNPGMDEGTASRIVDEALKFVVAAATSPERGLRPSKIVDEGWHGLILHTEAYAKLCERLGRFVHHRPERRAPGRHDASELDRTQAAIAAAGYQPDMTLWLAPTDGRIAVAAECEHSGCSAGGDCAAPCSSTPN
jgi:hypothetical protein